MTSGVASLAIRRGAHVVVRDHEGTQKVFFLGEACQDVKMGRYQSIPVDVILAARYGATLRRSEAGQWERWHPKGQAGTTEAVDEVQEDNRSLAQDGSAQSLSRSELQELKTKLSGEEIVEALANNSTTFATKTKFAQEKYLQKKAKKHVQQVTLLQPTLMELCETYMKTCRAKICGLRFDYLASIACQADVRMGGRYLVLDSAGGLVVGSLAQRLAGTGQVFRIFRGGCPSRGLTELDLGARQEVVCQVPIDVLQSKDPWSTEWLRVLTDLADIDGKSPTEEQVSKHKERQERSAKRARDMRALEAKPVDALIIVAGDEEADLAADALEAGLARLAPGGRLVIYGQHLQPLAAKQGEFRACGKFVDVRLHQLMTREYQVLPQRTHPFMTADANLMEGFLLTASKVIESAAGAEAAQGDAAADAEAPEGGRARKRAKRSTLPAR